MSKPKMNEAARWLPRSALESANTAACIAPCLANWSAAWLVAGAIAPLGAWRPCGDLSLFGATRRECGDAMMLCAEPEGLRALAGAMLGRSLDERGLRGTADRAVIDHLVKCGLDDLVRRITSFTASLPGSSGVGRDRLHRLAIGLDGQEVLAIEAEQGWLVAMAISMAGPPCKRARPAGRDNAIQAQNVAIAGFLGRNRLLLADLENLGIGDVLPLMSDAAAPLDLIIGTARIPDGATLSLDGDRITLHIERAASEWRIQHH